MKKLILLCSLMTLLSGAFAADTTPARAPAAFLAKDSRCFEMRTYYAAPGKLADLNARFRDHTNQLFVKHGITPIAYWVPADKGVVVDAKLIYVLAYPSREAREQSWKAFGADPAWKAAQAASETNGKLVARVESVFLSATDYSPMK